MNSRDPVEGYYWIAQPQPKLFLKINWQLIVSYPWLSCIPSKAERYAALLLVNETNVNSKAIFGQQPATCFSVLVAS
jgi:hypothetical protein